MVENIDISKADGLEHVRHKFIQCESVDTSYSDNEDDIGISIDWEKEEKILERKRKMTLLMILLAFLVTTAVMVMNVVRVERPVQRIVRLVYGFYVSGRQGGRMV